MEYIKKYFTSEEYQGESFSGSLDKKDESAWKDNEICTYVLVDDSGSEIVTGSVIRSVDLLTMDFLLGKTDTVDLFGIYKLLVYLGDTIVTEMNYVIAEYKLDYKKVTSRND